MKIKFKHCQRKRIRKFLSAVRWWNAQIIGSKTIGDYAGTMSDTCLRLGQ